MNEGDLFQRITEHAAVKAAEQVAEDVRYVAANQTAECESPIERVLLLALFAECLATQRFPSILPGAVVGKMITEGFEKPEPWDSDWFIIACQVQIKSFRVDILLHVAGLTIVIECDGHEFRDRTREQAQRDKSRDRVLQALGLCVFRFTGSEIWRDPISCAREVVAAVQEHQCCEATVGIKRDD